MSRFDSPLKNSLRRAGTSRVIEETWARIDVERSRRKLSGWVALFVAVCALGALVVVIRKGEVAPLAQGGGSAIDRNVIAESHPATETVVFDDGSILTKNPNSAIRLSENAKGKIMWSLERGRATFDIRPHGPRTWIVNAGPATVTVLGTSFAVDRNGDRVRVEVTRGRVRVTSPLLGEGGRELVAGESLDVGAPLDLAEPKDENNLADAGSVGVGATQPKGEEATGTASRPQLTAVAPAEWKVLAKQGDYAGAYQQLSNGRFGLEIERSQSSEDLMALADIARSSGHAADAVPALKKAAATKSADGSTAAFTLATLQDEALKNPSEAAYWYKKALELGLSRALREDAAARRVDALGRSGDRGSAASEAASYLNEFPEGRYAALVKPWIGAK